MTPTLPAVVADASALLATVAALPLEPPPMGRMLAPDGALVDVVAALRAFHDGRSADILGDLAVIGIQVTDWLPTHRLTTEVAELSAAHPDHLVGDLLAVAACRLLDLTLVTGQPDLAELVPAAIVLDRAA